MRHRQTARLASWQIRLLIMSGGGLWLSGCGWLLLHYFGQTHGDFGVEVSPMEPWMMKLHGLVLIPALLAVGGMFVVHIPKGWDHTGQRVAGLALCSLLALLIATGYLLYYVGDDIVRPWASIVHWSLGLSLPAVFVWHYINGLRARRRQLRR